MTSISDREDAPAAELLQGTAETSGLIVDWRKLCVIGMMFMAQTFPSSFTGSFIPTLLRKQGLPLAALWVFAIPQIPYWVRWVWAPVVDTYWSPWLGHRKTWLIPCTAGTAIAYLAMAAVDPTIAFLWLIVGFLFVKAIISTTLDVTIDGYAIDNINARERPAQAGIIASFEAIGHVFALVALAFVMQRFGWRVAAVSAALLMVGFMVPGLIRPEPSIGGRLGGSPQGPKATISTAFAPLVRYFRRKDTWVQAPIYFLSGLFTGALVPLIGPFLIDKKFNVVEVGFIVGLVLATANVVGATIAVPIVRRFGSRRLLLTLSVILIPVFVPAALYAQGHVHTPMLGVAALLLVPTVGMAIFYVTIVSMRLGFASKRQAATDYSTSAAVTRVGQTLAAGLGGPLAAAFGWPGFFIALGVLGAASATVLWMFLPLMNRLVAERDVRELGEAAHRQPHAILRCEGPAEH